MVSPQQQQQRPWTTLAATPFLPEDRCILTEELNELNFLHEEEEGLLFWIVCVGSNVREIKVFTFC